MKNHRRCQIIENEDHVSPGTEKIKQTHKLNFKIQINTLDPSIPIWKSRIPFPWRNSMFSVGYGSGHRHLQKKKNKYASNQSKPFDPTLHPPTNRREINKKWRNGIQYRLKFKRPQEWEVKGFGEAGAVDAGINHGEIEGRHEAFAIGLLHERGLEDHRAVADGLSLRGNHRHRQVGRLQRPVLTHLKRLEYSMGIPGFGESERFIHPLPMPMPMPMPTKHFGTKRKGCHFWLFVCVFLQVCIK